MKENKHISLEKLQTFLKPLKRLIDRKAESWDDLKNKPFKEENKKIVVIDSQFELFDIWDSGVPGNYLTFNSNLEYEKKYSIIYDGIEYICKYHSGELPFLGNAAIAYQSGFPINTDTGEPFFLFNDGGNSWLLFGLEMGTSHTIKIVIEQSIVTKKLDSKFLDLPKGILTENNFLNVTAGISNSNSGEIFNDYTNNYATTFAHAEGQINLAYGIGSHAEGSETKTQGYYSHAEGFKTEAYSNFTHAEGKETLAIGDASHAEGIGSATKGDAAHAEGEYSDAWGRASHAEGNSKATGYGSHSEGFSNSHGMGAHSESYGFAYGTGSHAEGSALTYGGYSHAEGSGSSFRLKITSTSNSQEYTYQIVDYGQKLNPDYLIRFDNIIVRIVKVTDSIVTLSSGLGNTLSDVEVVCYKGGVAYGNGSHVEGRECLSYGDSSHSEGWITFAKGDYSHAEGSATVAKGSSSHAEGNNTSALNLNAHAEGNNTISKGQSSHAEGVSGVALGHASHIEGGTAWYGEYNISKTDNVSEYLITPTKPSSQVTPMIGQYFKYNEEFYRIEEFNETTYIAKIYSLSLSEETAIITLYPHVAGGEDSHAEGQNTTSGGNCSHAEGSNTVAFGYISHVEGSDTVALGHHQHVQGWCNIGDTTSAHIVGNGSLNKRSNAHTLDWNGNAWFAGGVYVGSTSGTNKDEGSKRLATEEFVENSINSSIEVISRNIVLNLANQNHLLKVVANGQTTVTITVPLDSDVNFPLGSELEIVRYGTAEVSIANAEGVVINSLEGSRNIAGQYGTVVLKKMGTNEWLLGGALA